MLPNTPLKIKKYICDTFIMISVENVPLFKLQTARKGQILIMKT